MAVLGVALAGAGAAPPKSALRFVAAVEAAEKRLAAVRGQIADGLTAERFDLCFAVLEGPLPDAARAQVDRLELMAMHTATFDPTHTAIYDRIVADLDAVRTHDPALRTGRLSWRTEGRLGHRLPRMPGACDQMAACKAAGFATAAAPEPPARTPSARPRGQLGVRERAPPAAGGRAPRDPATGRARFMGDGLWNDVLPARYRQPSPTPFVRAG